MRLCIVGNSHIAALKEALDGGHDLRGHQVDVYAATTGLYRLEAGRLVAEVEGFSTSLGLAEGVVLANYDAMVICACGWGAARNRFIEEDLNRHPLGTVAPADLASPHAAGAAPHLRPVSGAVFEALVEAYVRCNVGTELALTLAASSPCALLMQPWPRPSESVREDPEWYINAWHGPRAADVWRAFYAAQYAALQRVAQAAGPRTELLDYPGSGGPGDGFMDPDLCSADPWHGSQLYGGAVLAQVLDWADRTEHQTAS